MSAPFQSRILSTILASLALIGFGNIAPAATVGSGGYTNAFSVQPVAGDWSTATIAGAGGDVTTIAQMDTAVQGVAPATITAQTTADVTDPPVAIANATWCSSGTLYLQTRPTGNRISLLMCTLVNSTGAGAAGARVSYDYAKVGGAPEEVEGLRAYHRLSTAGSWTPILDLSSTPAGRVTGDANVTWPAGATLYILWADDNGTPGPDTGNQIDNFSARTLPVVPLMITNQPRSLTNIVGASSVLCVGVSGSTPVYQWQKDNGAGGWVNLAGATLACYTNATSPLSAAGMYRVIVTNSLGSVTSQVAVLTVNPDTFGPLMSSAIVSEQLTTNRIVITFNENLLGSSVNMSATATTTSNHFVVYARAGGATNRVTVENVFYNSSPDSVAVIRVGGPNWNPGSNAYNGTINYYVIVNNVRDLVGNVIAPNSTIGVSFPNNSITNVLDWNAEWLSHTDWGLPPGLGDPTIYQQPWNQIDYDPVTNGHWGTKYGVVYKDPLVANPPTCRGTLGTLVDYVINPTLFRSTFVWPANLPTNVTLRLHTVMDDGAIIYLNGREIQRVNVGGTGLPDENTRSLLEYVDNTCGTNVFLNVNLRPGTNLLAVAVCQDRVAGANDGDIFWGASLDVVRTSYTTGAAPRSSTNSNALRIFASKIGANQTRLSWWTNVEPTHSNNLYNYTVVYGTNALWVGPAPPAAPNGKHRVTEFQLQPGITNGMVTNFVPSRLPYFFRLQRVP